MKVLWPGQSDAQSIVDKIFEEMGGPSPEGYCNGEFGDGRYAIMFAPGEHDVKVNVGYYTTVHGLGETPYSTTIGDLKASNCGGTALDNFWRSAENLRIVP